jgi:hypothetical protein
MKRRDGLSEARNADQFPRAACENRIQSLTVVGMSAGEHNPNCRPPGCFVLHDSPSIFPGGMRRPLRRSLRFGPRLTRHFGFCRLLLIPGAAYRSAAIESTRTVFLLISPVIVTWRRAFFPDSRTSSAALALPDVSSLNISLLRCTTANDFVLAFGAHCRISKSRSCSASGTLFMFLSSLA